MPHDTLPDSVLADLVACRLPGDLARSLPPAPYVSDRFATCEIDSLFRHTWLGIGRADRFAAAGDYETQDIAGQTIIVLRDKDGGLRAFANTCRHRGARLLDGRGNCRSIRCPFHAWACRLDGTLAAAPPIWTPSRAISPPCMRPGPSAS